MVIVNQINTRAVSISKAAMGSYHHNRLESQKISRVEALETLLTGAKPRTPHHQSPGRERHRKRKCLTILAKS